MIIHYTTGADYWIANTCSLFRFQSFSVIQLYNIPQLSLSPPLRQPIFAGFHKPLAEEGFGHGFEGFVLALEEVYFVVEAGENGSNGLLFGKRGEEDGDFNQILYWELWLCTSRSINVKIFLQFSE
jgi:hypothetical protein